MSRFPILGILAVFSPLVGFFFVWRLEFGPTAEGEDYTGMAIPLSIALTYGPYLLLGTLLGALSTARKESPKQIAWAGLCIAWTPVAFAWAKTQFLS